MKKIIYIFLASFLWISCSEDFHNNPNNEYLSLEQIQDLATASPESFLVVGGALDTGSNSYLKDWNQTGAGMHDEFGQKAIDLGLDLMANDMVQTTYHWFGRYYRYDGRTEVSRITRQVWHFYYYVIKNANEILDFIPADATNQDVLYLKGRAKALRAMAYFNLVRVYQHEGDGLSGVPLYLSNQASEGLPRGTVGEVKTQILADLTSAYSLLNGFTRTNKEQINQNVVAGLMARFYLEYGPYDQAVAMAQVARNASSLGDITDGFDEITNPGWIWGGIIDNENSTIYASFFSHMGTTDPGYAGLLGVYKSIDRRLYDAIPATDTRKNLYFSTYQNNKFVDATFFEGDYLYMRAAEMYLIEAEAKALDGDDTGAAQALFNIISTRDAAYTLSTNTGTALLDEIRLHRSIELWGEGFSWYDMKRWDRDLVRDYPGSNHAGYGKFNHAAGSSVMIFQIPDDELEVNPQINDADQNPI